MSCFNRQDVQLIAVPALEPAMHWQGKTYRPHAAIVRPQYRARVVRHPAEPVS